MLVSGVFLFMLVTFAGTASYGVTLCPENVSGESQCKSFGTRPILEPIMNTTFSTAMLVLAVSGVAVLGINEYRISRGLK